MPEILRGRLGPIRLASVLQLAEAEVFTGRVALTRGQADFYRGRVTGCRCGTLDGLAGLYELFLDETGDFALTEEPMPDAPALGPILGLVIEGCRLSDEWVRISQLVLRAVSPIATSVPDAQALIARLDGSRTVEQALRGPRAPLVDFILRACEARSLVEVPLEGRSPRAPTPAPAPSRDHGPRSAPVPVDFDGSMDLGRRHTREGNWDLAIRAFELALSVQPSDRVALQNLRRAEQARAGRVEKSAFQWFRRA
jgi:hypothetical protein